MFPNPLDELREIAEAAHIPVQAVGGLTIEQAIKTPEYGAPLVELGELDFPPAVTAVMNAIFNGTGKHIRTMPISKEGFQVV
jgi:CO/xanthine dehydrogenase Mo-binding subunit